MSSFSQFTGNTCHIHSQMSIIIIIIIILYNNGNRPYHQAGKVILIHKLSSAFLMPGIAHLFHRSPFSSSAMPDVAFLILVQVISCLSTDQHPYCRTLQSCGWQSHIIWKVPISNQETSCHGVHYFTQSPKHLPG